jgi:LytTr DNA-binding domain
MSFHGVIAYARCGAVHGHYAVSRLTEMRQMKLLIVDDEPNARSGDPADAGSEPARTLHEPQTAQESSGMGGSAFKLLVGEREHRLYPMNPETIDYIESDGNYVTIRSGSAKYISRDTIKRLSADLADVGFIRIERSLLVNIRAVAYVEAVGRGMFAFTLTSGAVLHSSTSYRDAILRVLPMRRLSIRRT